MDHVPPVAIRSSDSLRSLVMEFDIADYKKRTGRLLWDDLDLRRRSGRGSLTMTHAA